MQEERTFPGFVGAAAWNVTALMVGADGEHRGVDAVRRWLRESGYGTQRQSRGAFAMTLHLLELVFARQPEEHEWHESRPAGKAYVGSRAQLLRTMIGICVR